MHPRVDSHGFKIWDLRFETAFNFSFVDVNFELFRFRFRFWFRWESKITKAETTSVARPHIPSKPSTVEQKLFWLPSFDFWRIILIKTLYLLIKTCVLPFVFILILDVFINCFYIFKRAELKYIFASISFSIISCQTCFSILIF